MPDGTNYQKLTDTQFEKELLGVTGSLRRYARSLHMSRYWDVDDLIQRTMTRAWAKRDKYRPEGKLVHWLMALMHNEFINTGRYSSNRPLTTGVTYDEAIGKHIATSDPSAGLMVRDLRRALDKLNPEQKQVILLVGLDGLRYEEAAEALNIPVGTLRSRLSRGREALKQLMAK